jgi:heptaprenyl diphosphate synthase
VVYDAAVVVELTHLATLYHDDVMDEADRGVGAPRVRMRGGQLRGHPRRRLHLRRRLTSMMADLGPDTVRHFAETFGELVTGQMRETVGCPEGIDPVEHYMMVIQEKTGVLIASAGYLGCDARRRPEEHRDALFRSGATWARSSRSSTTSSTSGPIRRRPARHPGPTCARVCSPCRCSTRCASRHRVVERLREMLTGPVTDDALVDEALTLIRASDGRDAVPGGRRALPGSRGGGAGSAAGPNPATMRCAASWSTRSLDWADRPWDRAGRSVNFSCV